MQLTTTIDGWFWGNIAFGGLFGSTTDHATGAMYRYSPSQYLVTLQRAHSNPVNNLQSGANKVRQFVLLTYHPLAADITRGHGQYLSSLFSMLHTAFTNKRPVLLELRALLAEYPDIAQFANHVVGMRSDMPASAGQ
jgi:hypothetical protein